MKRITIKDLLVRSALTTACMFMLVGAPGAYAQKGMTVKGAKTVVAPSPPTPSADQARADAEWQTVLSPLIAAGSAIAFVGRAANTGEAARITWEAYTRSLRKYGLEFYDKYPKDPRRLAWLPAAVGSQP